MVSGHRRLKKFIIILSLFVFVMLVALTCIGFFYGNSSEELWGPYITANHYMPKTIYKINNQIYVPIDIDEDTGKLADDLPDYYGCVMPSAKTVNFADVTGKGEVIGKIEADFLNLKEVCNTDVYQLRTSSGIRAEDDVLITASGTYIAKINPVYSKNMLNDWEAYAKELDILIDTKLREEFGDEYYLHRSTLDVSPYYKVDTTKKYLNWHLFQKRLSFFFSDLKNIK